MKTHTRTYKRTNGKVIEISFIRENGEALGFYARINGKQHAFVIQRGPSAQELIDSI